jgi:glycosyltransferase 2 family protein
MSYKRAVHLVGIGLLVYLFYKIGFRSVVGCLRDTRVDVFVASFAVSPLIWILHTARFRRLLQLQGIEETFAGTLRYYLLGQYYGFVTPGKLGSLLRAWFIRADHACSLYQSVLPVVYDRLADILSLLTLGLFGVIRLFRLSLSVSVSVLGIGVIALAFAAALGQRHVLAALARSCVKTLVPHRLRESLFHGSREAALGLPGWHHLAFLYGTSTLGWICVYLQTWIIALSMDIAIPVYDYVIVIPLASIAGLIPITISGFGVREAVAIKILAYYGVAAGKALAFSLVAYSINALMPAVGGLGVVLHELIRNGHRAGPLITPEGSGERLDKREASREHETARLQRKASDIEG